MGERACRSATSLYGDFALTYEIVGDPPVDEAATADDRLPGRQPHLLLDARSADRRRPRVRRARHARQPARVHRQRSVRAQRSAAASPIGMRVAFKAADVAGGQAGRPRDRRRGAAGEGPPGRSEGLRADLRADGAGSRRTTCSCWCGSKTRQRRRADAGGARRDRAHRQGATGERPRRR